jgi:hypothetical protein
MAGEAPALQQAVWQSLPHVIQSLQMHPREFIEIIAAKCPSYQKPLSDCALAAIRQEENPSVRREKLDAMEDAEVNQLVSSHFLCVCRREGCGS